MSVNNNKDDLRRKLTLVRDGLLADYKAELDAKICHNLFKFITKLMAELNNDPDVSVQTGESGRHYKLSAYYPIKSEVDIKPFMNDFNSSQMGRLLLPSMQRGSIKLEFREWDGDEVALECLNYGVMQPRVDAASFEPDIILLPLLGVDGKGYRIGYGGGYYDATIYHLRNFYKLRNICAKPQLVGVSYDIQKLEGFIRDDHDQKMDYLITESGVLKFN